MLYLQFPLEINPTTSDATKEKMSYFDFVIAKEQKFLRKIFSEDELSSSDALKNIRSYHEIFFSICKNSRLSAAEFELDSRICRLPL